MVHPKSEDSTYLYQVFVSGEVESTLTPTTRVKKLAELAPDPHIDLKQFLGKQALLFADNLSHPIAYELKQKINQIGFRAALRRIELIEKEIGFSMVPEGEERTPYRHLAERLDRGEQVICKHCHTAQVLSAYCSSCGKQLIGKTVEAPSTQNTKSIKGLIIICLFTILLIGLVSWILFNR